MSFQMSSINKSIAGLTTLPRRTRTVAQIITRSFSDESLRNLLIDQNTRVIYQGFPGKRATINAKEAIANGTNVVGGVSPSKGGSTNLGIPVFSTVSEAVRNVRPDATLVHVPASSAAAAIEEAVAQEVPLIVAIAEHIPVHDMLRVHDFLRTQSKSRLLGPNSPGILRPAKCRLGIIPASACSPGQVGILSRSGTMVYEAIGASERAGLGQSLAIGLGGDSMPGTTMSEGLEVLLHDSQTEAIVLIGEIGGTSELQAAELIARYRAGAKKPKPIVGIISGRTAPPGRTMGHAGALLSRGEQGAAAKARVLENAGALVIPHLGMLESVLRKVLL